jgi:hypothetical protein
LKALSYPLHVAPNRLFKLRVTNCASRFTMAKKKGAAAAASKAAAKSAKKAKAVKKVEKKEKKKKVQEDSDVDSDDDLEGILDKVFLIAQFL